jgi:phage-related protein
VSQDAVGGRLYLDVVADASTLPADLKAKVDAAARQIRANIKVAIDQAKAEAELERLTTKKYVASIRADADTAAALAKLEAAAAKDRVTKIRAEADTAAAQAKLDATAAKSRVTQIRAEAQTARAEAQLAAATRKREVKIDLNLSGLTALRGAGTGLSAISALPALAGGIGILVSTVGNLAAGLVAVAGAGGQALGVLAALPNLAGVAAQGIGALVVGLSGIGEALKQTQAAEQATSAATGTAARARVAAAQRIADAQRSLQQAQRAADRAAVDGAEQVADARRRLAEIQQEAALRIEDAERDLTRAQLDARAAQDALNDAREEAREKLDDLALSLKGAALDEEGASLAVDRARQRLEQVNASVSSTGLDRREADLAYRQAIQRLEEVKDSNRDLREEYDEASRRGVEGSREVTSAQERVRDTQERVADAERDLARTRQESATQVADAQRALSRALTDQARANFDAQQRIADAMRNVADAQRSAAAETGAQATANAKLQQTLSRLSPAGREFVTFLRKEVLPALREVRNDVQQALLPPLQRAIQGAMPLLDTLGVGLVDSAERMGALAEAGAALVASPLFRGDVATIMASNNRALTDFGEAGLAAVSIARNLAVAAGPLVERFARWVKSLFESADAMVAANRESGKLQDFFERAGDRAAQLGRILGNVGRGLFGMFRSAVPAGSDLLDIIERVTKRFADFTNSAKGQDSFGAAFEAAVPVLQSVGGLLLSLLRTVGLLAQGGAGGGLAAFFNTLTAAVDWLNRALENPAVARFANQLLILAGVGGALGFLAGKVLSLVGALAPLLRILGSIPKVIGAIVTAVRVLGAAFLASGPWGWAIAAVIAIGIALVAAYKNFEGFRNFVNGTVRAVGAGFRWLWDTIIRPVFNAIGGVIRDDIIPAFKTLWTNGIRPVFRDIGEIISRVWREDIQPTFALIGQVLREDVGPAIRWLWRNIVQPAFRGIGQAITWAWNNIVKPAFAAWKFYVTEVVAPVISWLWRNVVRPAFNGIADAISLAMRLVRGYINGWRAAMGVVAEVVRWLWRNVVVPAWNGIKAAISTAWNGIKAIFGFLRQGVDNLVTAFRNGVANIKKFWEGLKKAAGDPVKFVINTVYNNGIRTIWNKVAGLVGAKTLDPIVVKGFARGGVIPGYRPGVDSVPAMLSEGEGVLVPEAVRGLARLLGTTAESAIDMVNSTFSTRVPRPGGGGGARGSGFALGGIGDWLGEKAKSVGSWVSEGLESVGSAIKDFALGSLRAGAARAMAPIRSLINRVLPAGDNFAGLMGRGANSLLDRLLGKIDKEDIATLSGGQFSRSGQWPPGGGGRIAANTAAAVAFIRDQWPSIRSIGTLGNRPNKSDHPMGKALDAMIPNWAGAAGRRLGTTVASWFVSNASRFGTKYVIYNDRINSGSGWRAYTHPNGPTRNPTLRHLDHVHVSFLNKGGVAGTTPLVRDGGGVLPPGLSAILNGTGRDELVLNDIQVNRLTKLATVGARATATVGPGGALADQVGQLVDAVRRSDGATVQLIARQESLAELARMVAVELEWMRR